MGSYWGIGCIAPTEKDYIEENGCIYRGVMFVKSAAEPFTIYPAELPAALDNDGQDKTVKRDCLRLSVHANPEKHCSVLVKSE